MPNIKFYPLDITYEVVENIPRILIFGRTIDNKQICLVDDSFKPYFYIVPKDNSVKEKLLKIEIENQKDDRKVKVINVEEVEKNYLEKKVNVLKVFTQIPKDIPSIKEIVKDWDDVELVTEYDILFVRRYLIDKNIIPLTLTEVEADELDLQLKVPSFKIKNIFQETDQTIEEPNILAIDIETYNPHGKSIDTEKNPILMISFYGKDYKKVITWKKFKTKLDYVEFVDGEVDLIERIKEIMTKIRPDMICGYFSDGFDLPYINARAKKYKIQLDLGLDNSNLAIYSRANVQTARVTGIPHIDVYKFIKKILRVNLDTDMFGLNDVAHELLGEKKMDVELDNLSDIWDNNPEKLEPYCEYNLHDSYLTYQLLVKSLPNIVEMVKIVGIPPYDIIRMGFSQLVEWYLLRQAPRYNELAPESPQSSQIKDRMQLTFKGGFVFEPKPGLYKDIIVYDFRSLYPTIISSHNISPATFNIEGQGKKVPLDDAEYYFKDRPKAFIPEIIEDIVKRRTRIKEIMKKESNPFLKARIQVLKLLANSFYGYLGFYGARWYSMESARSTTAYGRYYVNDVIGKAKKQGFKVLYADTDSCFLALGTKTREDADSFVKTINETLPGVMELEYEGFYPSGIFVSAKIGPYGAKKKYALLSDTGFLKLRGFEAVRRNWSIIAKEVQENVLNIILKENDKDKAQKYVREVVDNLKKKKTENQKVMINTQLRQEIKDYTSVGPHVAVAVKMKEQGYDVGPGTIVQYIVTQGSGPIRDRAKLPDEVKQGEYDAEYYINNQVIRAVESIFEVIGISKDDLIEKEQKNLNSFFG